MTDRPQVHESSNDTPSLSCSDVTSLLASYAAGTVDDAVAHAVEWHGAHCRRCEPLIENALATAPHVRGTSDAMLDITPYVPFGGPDAEALRRRTLAQLKPLRPRRQHAPAWTVGVGVLLAASLILLTRGPEGERATSDDGGEKASADSMWSQFPGATSAPMRTAVRLAQRHSAAEFAALDTAIREVDRAIAAAPAAEELREFRVALDARRRELETRVARVTE